MKRMLTIVWIRNVLPSILIIIAFQWLCLTLSGVSLQCYHYTSNNPDPCSLTNCTFGEQCIVSSDGQTSECVCPKRCPSYGDSRGSRLVCGSNGVDYPNVCELNLYSCTAKKEINVRYNGSCDPCNGVKCPPSQICQLDDNRNPICNCILSCSQEFSPVCGNNGKTYINECILRAESCKNRKNIKLLHQGVCAETNGCKALKCQIYQDCEINRYGIAGCSCLARCSKKMNPVCGTDSETYDNECELQLRTCQTHKNVTIRYYGVCDQTSFCHKNHGICKFGSICKAINENDHICLCPHCTEEYQPVCGSNGITYVNICKFRKDMCERRLSNVTFQEGPCIGCEYINCQFYSYCQAVGGKGKCVCPLNCEDRFDPVCGSDLVTYPNECELQQRSCLNKVLITIIKRGKCNSCKNVHCDNGARCENGECVCPKKCPTFVEPVCGSDNITYDNHCKLLAASCDNSVPIRAQFKGSCAISTVEKDVDMVKQDRLCHYNTCKFGGVCVMANNYSNSGSSSNNKNNQTKCLCSFDQICGNDGRIYENECWLEEEMCLRQQAIKRHEMSFCEKFKNIPCQGEPPLIDSMTKKEIDCFKEKCPKEAYCHKGADFAKCCKDYEEDEDCYDTVYGCCPDERTPALGPNYAGCPSTCQCNRLGSYLFKCDPISKQCYCKPGVGGLRCDRCEAGFWGLHKIAEGNSGCIPCNCNRIGSSRDDCEQMSGLCVCKSNFIGVKCDMCSNGYPIESEKCFQISLYRQKGNFSCTDSQCKFGAVCHLNQCVCSMECSDVDNLVCGSDGNIYRSECHLRQQSCLAQKLIELADLERCLSTVSTTKQSATTSPGRRSTEQNVPKDNQIENDYFVSTSPTRPNVHRSSIHKVDKVDHQTDKLLNLNQSLCFNEDSFIEMKTLETHTKVKIQIKFVPFSSDGIILYNGQTSKADGDYMAIVIRNSRIELRFNLGSGNVLLQSTKAIKLGKLTSIIVEQYLAEAMLSIVDQENITGKSEGLHKLLDLGENLFIGGTPYRETKRLGEILGTRKGFIGCIQSIELNGAQIDHNLSGSKDILNAKDVHIFNKDKCSQQFCHNHGKCLEKDKQTLICLCQSEFKGNQCQQYQEKQEIEVFEFFNNSYIQLPTLQGVSQAFIIEIWMMARFTDGVILYNSQSKGDFVELLLKDSYVHFNFDLGGHQSNKSGLVNIRSNVRIKLEEWYRIIITRKFKEGSLQINDHEPIKMAAQGHLNELNLDQPLYIGGSPSMAQEKHFKGAIQRIVVNGNIWRNILNRSISQVNVQKYEGLPCGYYTPCHNGGKCLPYLNDYICKCPDNFDGKHCKRIKNSKSIRISNNTTTINVNLTEIIGQQKNIIEIRLRTFSDNGLILWINSNNESFNKDYLAVAISNGNPVFSFNLGKQKGYFKIRSTIKINDGEIHNIIIYRNQRLGVLEIDERQMSTAISNDGATDVK